MPAHRSSSAARDRAGHALLRRLVPLGLGAALLCGSAGLTPLGAGAATTVAASVSHPAAAAATSPADAATAKAAAAAKAKAAAHARAVAHNHAVRAKAKRARAAAHARAVAHNHAVRAKAERVRAAARARARALAASSLGVRAVRLAASRAGSPYVYGAEGPRAFDCSGLVMWVYDHLGKNLPRTAGAQYTASHHISRHALKRGDLVFFASSGRVYHVAIYAGNGYIWAAPYPGKSVEREKLWTTDILAGRVR